jgi:cell division septation protein DedD
MPTFPKPDLKVDRKTATKPLYAGAGFTDLAVAFVREYVTGAQLRLAGAQKRVADLEPQALRDQATTAVNARVEALSKDAKARRGAIEKRVADLQSDAKDIPAKLQAFLDENVTAAHGVYDDLATRGEGLVTRIRNQESAKATAASAKTATAKAKTTKTQAGKATKSTATSATSTAKKKSAAPKSSAKATATAATKTASSATEAAGDAASKVGD